MKFAYPIAAVVLAAAFLSTPAAAQRKLTNGLTFTDVSQFHNACMQGASPRGGPVSEHVQYCDCATQELSVLSEAEIGLLKMESRQGVGAQPGSVMGTVRDKCIAALPEPAVPGPSKTE